MTTAIKTKYGTARINKRGYYLITSRKEGNNGKLLHRLIYEDCHNVKLPKNIAVHHIDENKTNNDISNLQIMKHEEHAKHHKIPLSSKLRMSKDTSSTGYFRVSKQKNKECKNGFIWKYQYYDENGIRRRIHSVDLKALKEKVLAKGLEWYEVGDTDESANI